MPYFLNRLFLDLVKFEPELFKSLRQFSVKQFQHLFKHTQGFFPALRIRQKQVRKIVSCFFGIRTFGPHIPAGIPRMDKLFEMLVTQIFDGGKKRCGEVLLTARSRLHCSLRNE